MSDAKKDPRILIVGLARNSERDLPKDIAVLRAAFAGSHPLRWLVIESDSSDETVACLSRLEVEVDGFQFESLGKLRDRMPSRTERIAYCRNRYLERIRNDATYADVDIVVVADLDGINRKLTEQAVRSCWERDDWQVCTANQRAPYYDIWALRHPLWGPVDCYRQFYFLWSLGMPHERALQLSTLGKMFRIPEAADWIEVDSAFGGLALYRRDALLEGAYEGLDENGNEVCEHVSLHADIRRRGGRIFLNPRLINAGQTPHSRELWLHQRILRGLKDIARRFVRKA